MTTELRNDLIELVEQFLLDATAQLVKRRVLPPSMYKTYLRVGADFEGSYLMSLDSYRKLETALGEYFPEFFKNSEKLLYWAHPSMYLCNIVTRAIDKTDWNQTNHLGDKVVVELIVDELISTFRSDKSVLLKSRQVSHLSTENNEVLFVRNLEIRPSGESLDFEDSVQWVESKVRGAFNDWDRVMSLSIERPLALITQKIEGDWEFVDSHYSDRSEAIGGFILACRLIYNATIRNYWEVMGSTNPLSPYRPSRSSFSDYDGLISLIRKNAEIEKIHIPGIEWLIKEIDFIFSKPELQTATPLEIGLSNFTKSFFSGKNIRAIADLATCLESIMIQGSSSEIGLKLRSRTAALIYTETDSIQLLYKDITNLYDLRSTLIHGGAVDEKQLMKILNKIVQRNDVSTTEKLALAVYRFQDIVRRALLARITLEALPISPWSSSNYPNIDALLADATFRKECRDVIHEKLNGVGLSFAFEESTPAIVTFVDQDSE